MSLAHADWVVVLAAGNGRRMGGPKALMDVGGETWWRTQTRRLDEAGLRQVWVVSQTVRNAMESGDADPEWMVVADPDAPMFESVLAGLSALEGEDDVAGAFILPVDVPGAPPETWNTLRGDPTSVRVPTLDGATGHPIWLGWDFVERHVLSAPVDSRLDALTADAALRVAIRDPGVTTNLNTPEDVARWLGADA